MGSLEYPITIEGVSDTTISFQGQETLGSQTTYIMGNLDRGTGELNAGFTLASSRPFDEATKGTDFTR
jgi:hypothetical protein